MNALDAIVVGGGVGGLAAAIALGAAGKRVRLIEAAQHIGGKIGTVVVDGVEVDTGPSVLTLPDVVAGVFARAGLRLEDRLTLVSPRPAFRYHYAGAGTLDVFVDLDETLASVRATLGTEAADELARYLDGARAIWEASKDDFVFAVAPTLPRLVRLAMTKPRKLFAVDALRSMARAIFSQVRSPELRLLLLRYATYNGSNPWQAPATLGCIAHVELELGGFGVKGGMAALARALEEAARGVGVDIVTGTRVDRVVVKDGVVVGVDVAGAFVAANNVVVNADVGWLRQTSPALLSQSRSSPSMSGATAILKARRRRAEADAVPRVAHEVLFSSDYERETQTIFAGNAPPTEPTIYLCAQEAAHGRRGWAEHEPVFAMVNVPPLGTSGGVKNDGVADDDCLAAGLARARARGLLDVDDDVLWRRGAAALAHEFPGSDGSLYGASSNDRQAAFRRPGNASGVPGLFLASGSAHPGGGVPLCLQSGLLAADALLSR